MNIFAQITEKIIQEQESVIGPIALEQAKKVPGLTINWENHEVILAGNEKEILNQLVNNYKHLFGQASVEVCKDAVRSITSSVPKSELPVLLQ